MEIYRLIPNKRNVDLGQLEKRVDHNVVSGGLVRLGKLELRFYGLHNAASVSANGVRQYRNDGSRTLPDGTKVRIWIDENDFFICARLDEWLAEEHAKEARHQQRADEELNAFITRERAKQAEAETFNALLQVPVRWLPGITDIQKELSENPTNRVIKARAVIHVLLEESLNEHRLTRSIGSFLCNQDGNGKRWEAEPFEAAVTRVSCKRCLELTKRWKNK